MPVCGAERVDGSGVRHRCFLPAENRDPTLVHVHVCGEPYRRFLLGPVGECNYGWTDDEPVSESDALAVIKEGEHGTVSQFRPPPSPE